MTAYLSGKTDKSPRNEFWYVNDDGQIVAARYGDWKVTFLENRGEAFGVWREPFVELRVPLLFNLRRDPFEISQHNSNTYNDWFLDRPFVIVPIQGLAARFLLTMKEYPPSQRLARSISARSRNSYGALEASELTSGEGAAYACRASCSARLTFASPLRSRSLTRSAATGRIHSCGTRRGRQLTFLPLRREPSLVRMDNFQRFQTFHPRKLSRRKQSALHPKSFIYPALIREFVSACEERFSKRPNARPGPVRAAAGSCAMSTTFRLAHLAAIVHLTFGGGCDESGGHNPCRVGGRRGFAKAATHRRTSRSCWPS